jgi:membrane associated rhomboid family serine protease
MKPMSTHIFDNFIPAGTGSIASLAISFNVLETAAQAAIFAFVGGLIGWGVSRALNKLFPKK